MKRSFYLILFFSIFTPSPYSQQDTTHNGKNGRGFSILGGLGVGGNKEKQGFSRGLSIGFHYRFHTFESYASRTTEHEADYVTGHDLTLTYDSYNFGVMYGPGIHKEHFSVAILGGIGYSSVMMITKDGSFYAGYYHPHLITNYDGANACLGFQSGVYNKGAGVGVKFYCNFFSGIYTYTFLVGLQVNLQ